MSGLLLKISAYIYGGASVTNTVPTVSAPVDTPKSLVCPLTGAMFVDPVVCTVSGVTYERQPLVVHLGWLRYCPTTNKTATLRHVVPNLAMKGLVAHYRTTQAANEGAGREVGRYHPGCFQVPHRLRCDDRPSAVRLVRRKLRPQGAYAMACDPRDVPFDAGSHDRERHCSQPSTKGGD